MQLERHDRLYGVGDDAGNFCALTSVRRRIIHYQMTRYRILVLLAVICGSSALACAQTKWLHLEDFRFNWNDHSDVHVTLEIPSQWNDPGDFTRIRIQVPGHKDFVLSNNEGWVKYNSDMASVSSRIRARENLIPSKYVLALAAASGRTLLFLTGYSYASSPGRLDVLELSERGQPQVVLHQEELGLEDVLNLDRVGVADVVAYPCLSEDLGNGLITYDPFNVYRLASVPGHPALLSIPLSRTYNLHHYYGWAGPDCGEKTVVVLHPPHGGKPMVMNLKRTENRR